MRAAEIYLDAARRVAEGEESFSCCALASVREDQGHGWRMHSAEAAEYLGLFAPSVEEHRKADLWESFMSKKPEDRLQSAIGREYSDFDCNINSGRRHLRVMLLCMMAAVAE